MIGRRTNINNCKIVGCKNIFIEGNCGGEPIAESWDCDHENGGCDEVFDGTGEYPTEAACLAAPAYVNTCHGLIDSGVAANFSDFADWILLNVPTSDINNYMFENVFLPAPPANGCEGPNGGYYMRPNPSQPGWFLVLSGVISSPYIPIWGDFVTWMNANGCIGLTVTGMDLTTIAAIINGPGCFTNAGVGFISTGCSCTGCGATWTCDPISTCYDPGDGSGLYSTFTDCINNSPCTPPTSYDCGATGCYDPGTGLGQYSNLAACAAACSVSYDCENNVCVDPGTGSGAYSSLAECELAGCNFDPRTDTNGTMELWLRARSADMLINTPPFIDKWDDVSSGSGIQYNAAGGLGTGNRPTWDGVAENVMFDGNDWLDSATSINLNTSADNGWCIAVTVFMDNWATGQVVIGDDNSNNGLIKFASATGIQMKLWNPTAGTATTKGVTIDTPASLVNNKQYVFIWNMDPITNDVRLYIDGVVQTNFYGFPMGYDFHSLDEIGAKNNGSQAMQGGIKEYIVYKGVLSTTNIAHLNTYMHDKI